MKSAKVIPIFKFKAKDDLSNYHSILILPTISKLLEKVVCKRLIQKSDILYGNPYHLRHMKNVPLEKCPNVSIIPMVYL